MPNEQTWGAEELSNTQDNVSETHNEKYLVTHDALQGTPFHITGNKEKGYFIRMGAYRLTEYFATIEDAEDALEKESWNILLTILAAVKHMDGDTNIKMEGN